MTLEKIERHLPNGFHDAVLRRLAINYVDGTATFHLSVSAGDPDAKSEPERENTRMSRSASRAWNGALSRHLRSTGDCHERDCGLTLVHSGS